MSNAIVISAESARIIAAEIRPLIKAYIEQNHEKYETWLELERKKKEVESKKHA